MKFAKELEQDLVPEWRVKYLDYKAGKKHVKAVAKAVNRASSTPRLGNSIRQTRSPFFQPSAASPLTQRRNGTRGSNVTGPLRNSPAPYGADSPPASDEAEEETATTPMLIPRKQRENQEQDSLQYGSFIRTPPQTRRAPQLALPDPALEAHTEAARHRSASQLGADGAQDIHRSQSTSIPDSAYEVGHTTPPPHRSAFASLRGSSNKPPTLRQSSTVAWDTFPRPLLRRIFSHGGPLSKTDHKKHDFNLDGLHDVRNREREFVGWMDQQLEKIETFYKMKEDEGEGRLNILRDQLHEMRDRRIDEIARARRDTDAPKEDGHTWPEMFGSSQPHIGEENGTGSAPLSHDNTGTWISPLERMIGNAKTKTMGPRPGANSKALLSMGHSPDKKAAETSRRDPGEDYVRRHYEHEVPYRSAKRKLKLALKEFYRGLELLKSYALLNRTAFRKINKKYDKAINAHPPMRYMNEKVNNAWFVNSDALERHIHAVEDLYARYFERGNYKVAVGKLRSSKSRSADFTNSAFRSGILIGTGTVFAVQGVIYAAGTIYYHPDPVIRTQASYLLQIYAGYFLALYLFWWFCLDCSIWTRNKINYPFIFELDPRHQLNWRELSEFPAFVTLLFGLFIWINFSGLGASVMFIYYPVILIFATTVLIFFPAPTLFYRSRRWFAYSHWRLLLAGLYPVEFRDFFLGDIYCSLTYFMSNIELFFCLYAQNWSNPSQCNSTHSRLLGFFSTLPGIWRALQCLRRYYDTRAVFPHLANCGKYGMTILYYVTLSLYRIDNTYPLLALFIAVATVNSVYASIWDLAMDWSLCQPQAKKRFLRDVRGYKNVWFYYGAMVLDPILRFNWIFYPFFTHDTQHSSLASFFVAFSEVTRRGIWVILRVENEHCANVARFKASRDVPLPYEFEASPSESISAEEPATVPTDGETTATSPTLSRHRSRIGTAEEGDASSIRRRVPTRSFTRIFADAHTQDFEKKRKPGAGDSDNISNMRRDESDLERANSSDDDDDDEQDVLDTMRATNLTRRVGDRDLRDQ